MAIPNRPDNPPRLRARPDEPLRRFESVVFFVLLILAAIGAWTVFGWLVGLIS